MSKTRIMVYGGLAVVAAVLLGTVFLGARADDANRPAAAAPLAVPVFRVALQQGTTISTGYAGIIMARRTSALGFERGGLVVQVGADIGKHVRKGDVLARLDTRVQRADLAAARASLHQRQAQTRIAASTLKRQQTLLAKGHISAQHLEEINAKLDVARAAQNAAVAQIQTLKARLALSQITAPYDGVIAERYIDEGAIASPGTPVLSLVEDGILEIRVGIPSSRLGVMTPGHVYDFKTASARFQARLRGLGGQVDRATQTVDAAFDVLPSKAVLVPGQTARLILDVPLAQSGFWAPLAALREDRRGLWSLYALQPAPGAPGRYDLSPRLVEMLYAGAERVYVRGPVRDGEMILASGKLSVSTGMQVTPALPRDLGQP